MSNSYWEGRALANQEKAFRLANTYTKRQKQYYKDAYNIIELRLSSLMNDIEIGVPLSRTQLWQMVKYSKLKEEIENQFGFLGRRQLNELDELANRVYEETLGLSLAEFRRDGKFNTFSTDQVQQVLNSSFETVKYSEKVWGGSAVGDRIGNNMEEFSRRVMKDMEDMICLGKSPTAIKERLADDFNTSFNQADRLVRTEASYIYNTAAIDGYKAAGIEKVEFYPEPDCCEDCEQLKGVYPIDNAPLLPVHPNCRCCYIPIVE